MAANLELKRYIGTDGAQQRDAFYNGYVQISALDSAQIDSGIAPIGKPTDNSSAFSTEAWFALYMTQVPDNTVDNVRFWWAINVTSVAAGVFPYVGTSFASTRFTPVRKSSGAALAAASYTSPGTSLLWSDIALTAVGHSTYPLCFQLHITSTSGTGDILNNDSIFHYSYDEA